MKATTTYGNGQIIEHWYDVPTQEERDKFGDMTGILHWNLLGVIMPVIVNYTYYDGVYKLTAYGKDWNVSTIATEESVNGNTYAKTEFILEQYRKQMERAVLKFKEA